MSRNDKGKALAVGITAGVITIIAVSVISQIAKRKPDPVKKSLYDRLGGIYPISMVVNEFSDRVMDSPVVGRNSPNQYLREWATRSSTRLPGLKWMRTLWLADSAGGPYSFVSSKGARSLNLADAHCPLRITAAEFAEVARILKQTLVDFKIPEAETGEVLQAFAAHAGEVESGSKGGACPFASAR